MNQRAPSEPFFSSPLPDAPWPVQARNLLTDRELSLYQSLLSLFPEHKIFVQVALSQLIDVPRDHPERQSIRNRFSQFVADFVLCRTDFSVVAVIELDDRSHEHPRNKYADARKSKALKDARIRLVRIPAGALPSEARISKLIDADGAARKGFRRQVVLRLAETFDAYENSAPEVSRRSESNVASRMWRNLALKVALAGVLAGVWFIYSQYVQSVFKTLSPLAAHQVVSPVISQAAVAMGPSVEVAAATRRAEPPDAKTLQKQKNLAWAAFYTAPASCEHPVDWNAQVECGNQYIRATRKFEARWAVEHGSGLAGAVMLQDGTIGISR